MAGFEPENLMKMDDLGGPLFLDTSIWNPTKDVLTLLSTLSGPTWQGPFNANMTS